jgi:hypothetical protein
LASRATTSHQPLLLFSTLSEHDSRKKGHSKRDPRLQLRYKPKVQGHRGKPDTAIRLTKEMRFLGNKEAKLKEYWTTSLAPFCMLYSLLEVP